MVPCDRSPVSPVSEICSPLRNSTQTVDLNVCLEHIVGTKSEVPIMKTRHALPIAMLAVLALTATPALAAPCESLSTLKLPDTTITAAESVAAAAGARGGAATPAHCRVRATIRPTSDSEIKIEVWMPAAGWNGKFQGVGNGAWQGSIGTAALATAVQRGYAA